MSFIEGNRRPRHGGVENPIDTLQLQILNMLPGARFYQITHIQPGSSSKKEDQIPALIVEPDEKKALSDANIPHTTLDNFSNIVIFQNEQARVVATTLLDTVLNK